MRRAFDVVFTLLMTPIIIVAACVIGTLGVLPFAVLPRGRRERYSIRGAIAFARATSALVLADVIVTGEVRLPDERGALVICNHRSWFDPLLLIATTSSQGLSKAGIFWIPFVGLYGWLSGAVFFDRTSKEARAAARDEVLFLLRSGARVHVFPEGTRSRDGELRDKVYLTLVRDCYEAKLPVVSCAVMHTERVFPLDLPILSPGRQCRVDIGQTHDPADFTSADAFADACWGEVKERVEALQRE